MDIIPLFCENCESLMSDPVRSRQERQWFETGLAKTIEELRKFGTEDVLVDNKAASMEDLLMAWVLGNQSLDARANVAWRMVGRNDLGMDLVKDLIPIEERVAVALVLITGHAMNKQHEMTTRKALRIAGAIIVGGGLLAAGGAVAAPIIGTALAASTSAATTAAFLQSSAGIGLVAGVFGTYGANRTAWKMIKREGALEEFSFLPALPAKQQFKSDVNKSKTRRSSWIPSFSAFLPKRRSSITEDLSTKEGLLVDVSENATNSSDVETSTDANHVSQKLHCIIGISGWLLKEEASQLCDSWSLALNSIAGCEKWTIAYDRRVLYEYGTALRRFVLDQGIQSAILHAAVLAAGHTVTLAAAPPSMALMLQDVVDSPYAVAKNRAKLAGEELANALSNRAMGNRPVTLVGFGFGATVVATCLEKLAERKDIDVEGIIQDVVMFGAPIQWSNERWKATTRVVAGLYVNCYCPKDMVLNLLVRLSTKLYSVAGVSPIQVEGIVNKPIESMGYEIGTNPSLIDRYLKEVLTATSTTQ